MIDTTNSFYLEIFNQLEQNTDFFLKEKKKIKMEKQLEVQQCFAPLEFPAQIKF